MFPEPPTPQPWRPDALIADGMLPFAARYGLLNGMAEADVEARLHRARLLRFLGLVGGDGRWNGYADALEREVRA